MTSDLPGSERPPFSSAVGLKESAGGSPAPGVAGPRGRHRHQRLRRRMSTRRRVVEWVAIVAIALVVALLMRVFVVQTFYIPSTSMAPTLNVGDRIIVNKLAYRFHGVGRGDIIVFKRPPAENCGSNVTDLVKRVVGLPGETISDRNGTVYIDGKPLAQPWLPKHDPNTYTPSFKPVHIGPNSYFVMGDNRAVSCDSRYWGTVPRSLVIGKVEMRIWPLSRIGFF